MTATLELLRTANPEVALLLIALAVSAFARGRWARALGWWERPLARMARHRTASIVFSALLPVVLRLSLLGWYPPPEPRSHDEFSFLLGADTLGHGRLTNPQHPHWVHFESMHMLARPIYASAFPLGQAAMLALGKTVVGYPWAGVVASVALMCGAVCWMLQGWLPPRWALLGAVLLALRIGVSSYWMNSYWGGALAAAGGALVLGALPRIVRRPDWRMTAVIGCGLMVLAQTRTVEGAWLGAISVVAISASLRQVVLPFLIVSVLIIAATLAGFAGVTGSPFVPPYSLYRSTLTVAPHFLWQSPRAEPLYNNREMRHFYTGIEMADYRAAQRIWPDMLEKTGAYRRFFIGPLLLIPSLMAPLMWRRRDARRVVLMGAAFSVVLAAEVWHNPHYAAPATGLCMAAVVMGMRFLRSWRCRAGMCFVRLLPLACCLSLCGRIAASRAPDDGAAVSNWRWTPAGGVERAGLLRHLTNSGGRHLVLVRYGPWHDTGNEWVYNGADIDGSTVVWARELDPASNAELIAYFKGRQTWLAQPDQPGAGLIPYEQAPFRPMPFVRLGAPGIEALRSADEVRRRVLEAAGGNGSALACDVWNYYFAHVTGVQGPDVAKGCYDGDRGRVVRFEQWWDWLLRQRE